MKKFTLFFIGFILLNLTWMAFVREKLPPVPTICAELSDRVDFNFNIKSVGTTGIELGLDKPVNGKGMFVQFKMANAWKTGRLGLVVEGIRANGFNIGMPPTVYLNDARRKEKSGKDFSDFMKDKKGNEITSYNFQQTLVEGESGQKYMQIVYTGKEMEMIETLEVPRPLPIPAHISKQFIDKGLIQFQPGTVAFDPKIKGFNIPVVIL
ncbi:MAG TPA: hypothetical protein PKB07_18115 [Flavilitoribacter sp.]|nr:hypothetical protein [Flavilitoribacter sp.]